MRQSRPILIAGAGIGGLAVGLALARAGFKCRLLERQPEFSQAGAGIQIGPNGVAALRELGVADVLAPNVGCPAEVRVHDGRSGRMLAALPLGEAIEQRLGAPYWTAHRADLHAALLACAQRHAGIVIQTGFEVARLEAMADGVRVTATDGATATGPALIGADGLWSKVRHYVADRVDMRFTGSRAYRTVMATADIPAALQMNATGLWLARHAHVVHYPVRGIRDTAVIMIVPDDEGREGWNQPADAAALVAATSGMTADLQQLAAASTQWRSWSLSTVAPLERWTNGAIALTGDAAHPVLPFLAQGGVLAIEDGLVLAAAMAREPDIPRAFEAYAQQRMARAVRVGSASRRNGRIYHLSGAAAVGRNIVMAMTPAPRLIARYDWLYGWKPGP